MILYGVRNLPGLRVYLGDEVHRRPALLPQVQERVQERSEEITAGNQKTPGPVGSIAQSR